MTTTKMTRESMGNGEKRRRSTIEEITTSMWKAVGRRLQREWVGSPQRSLLEHRKGKFGGEWGEDTMNFNASSSTIGDDEPYDRDPDCKFDNRGDRKI